MRQSITALIIARDEAEMIANCIESLRWCSEIVVVDSGSLDGTGQIAENLGCRVISFKHSSFARLRNEALKRAKTDWVIYIDADERVTPTLAREILVNIETQTARAFSLKRENILYGYALKHGGWNTDVLPRVFARDSLKEWQGEIHETPLFEGEAQLLHTPLIHLTHRSTSDNLYKSSQWTPMEARLLYESGIPPVTFATLLRKGLMEFWRRAIKRGGYKDGLPGLIEAMMQGINRVCVYIQVWELQQKPNLPERYQQLELDIHKQWQSAEKV